MHRRGVILSRIWDAAARRIGSLFPKVTRYRFEPAVLATMRELALQTHPKEVIGLLRGRTDSDELVVDTIVFQPFVNSRMSASITIDSSLTGTVGTFHSHPGASARPSAQDLRLFGHHGGIHGIIAEPYEVLHVYNTHGRLLGTHEVRVDQQARQRAPRVR